MSELKPCPFCGGGAFYIKIMGNYEKPHEIYCSKCDGAITEGWSEKQVVTNWNTRPIEDDLRNRIAELETDNAELKERVAMLDVTAVFKSLGEMRYIEQVATLNARIAELEEQVWDLNLANEKLESAYFADETIAPDGTLKPSVRKLLERLEKSNTDCDLAESHVTALLNRIAELEADSVQIQYICEDELPEGISDEVFSAMYACSTVDFVRVYPYITIDGHKRFLFELPEVQE